tara:strand:+ start:55224 stop:55349 length:126 start_codon:yes stop_codon:yes gene_type:complete
VSIASEGTFHWAVAGDEKRDIISMMEDSNALPLKKGFFIIG